MQKSYKRVQKTHVLGQREQIVSYATYDVSSSVRVGELRQVLHGAIRVSDQFVFQVALRIVSKMCKWLGSNVRHTSAQKMEAHAGYESSAPTLNEL